MLRLKVHNTRKEWVTLAIFYILLFQNPLSSVLPIFNYVDEAFSLIGVLLLLHQGVQKGRIRLKKKSVGMVLGLSAFVVTGLTGNILYAYQPASVVLTDLLVNLKFFLSIVTGYMLFHKYSFYQKRDVLTVHARAAALILFLMLLADQFFHVFSSPETRYGLRVSQLIFGHATYLTGAMVFLVSVLTVFYEKRNRPYIIMCLIVQFFTLRGKAIAGAVAYILLVYFILIYRKKLKIWHIAIMGLAAFWIARDQFIFYYVDLEGRSARSVLTLTSFEILKDYFPIGTGFGTYASASAGEYYSPVYEKYGFLNVYELGGNDSGWGFYSDTFWPIIIGQTGFIGVICYVLVLVLLFRRILGIREKNIYAYTTGIYMFVYLLISSTSEPAFNNSVAIPLAALLGYIFSLENQKPKEEMIGS